MWPFKKRDSNSNRTKKYKKPTKRPSSKHAKKSATKKVKLSISPRKNHSKSKGRSKSPKKQVSNRKFNHKNKQNISHLRPKITKLKKPNISAKLFKKHSAVELPNSIQVGKSTKHRCPNCQKKLIKHQELAHCQSCQLTVPLVDLERNIIEAATQVFQNKKNKLQKNSKSKSLLPQFKISDIKKQIEDELSGKKRIQVSNQKYTNSKKHSQKFIQTGVPGFDDLLHQGIPMGAAVLLSGGAGSGKTIFGLQSLAFHASSGKKCLYMSFEESESKLISHMEQFGINAKSLIKKNKLLLQRFNPFDITRSVDALLMKAKGELLIDVKPIIFPKNFKPDVIVVDSLTAIASAFTGKEDSYRIYIEQLFRFFEEIGATSYLITETTQVPTIYSTTGVEEFLADSVVVLYNIRRGNVRERAIEMLKLRGAGHENKIVSMNITSEGIRVYPEQEVFGDIDN
jgi:KaiC/GvpD/RAD55 family RecA-like ATPase